jgi:hypothetical protein
MAHVTLGMSSGGQRHALHIDHADLVDKLVLSARRRIG